MSDLYNIQFLCGYFGSALPGSWETNKWPYYKTFPPPIPPCYVAQPHHPGSGPQGFFLVWYMHMYVLETPIPTLNNVLPKPGHTIGKQIRIISLSNVFTSTLRIHHSVCLPPTSLLPVLFLFLNKDSVLHKDGQILKVKRYLYSGTDTEFQSPVV